MTDFEVRLAVVAGAIAATIIITALLRARSSRLVRRIGRVALDPGIYLFSSAACAECEAARQLLTQRLGPEAFVEFRWEDDPAPFRRLGIGEVPATLRVGPDGVGTLWKGRPPAMFSDVDP